MHQRAGGPGARTPRARSRAGEAFWRQLCWREFYHHHLARHPEVARAALREDLRGVAWDDDPAGVRAWAAGETGFPMVDAGMRQLAETGWMHNRARMVVGFVPGQAPPDRLATGRVGLHAGLVDGDPASNNGGWQWTAGTGTDAAPYFRVLNPTRQAERFDPAGAYVRRWVPELRDVPDARIHEPWRMSAEEQRAAGCRIGGDYPAPGWTTASGASSRSSATGRRAGRPEGRGHGSPRGPWYGSPSPGELPRAAERRRTRLDP